MLLVSVAEEPSYERRSHPAVRRTIWSRWWRALGHDIHNYGLHRRTSIISRAVFVGGGRVEACCRYHRWARGHFFVPGVLLESRQLHRRPSATIHPTIEIVHNESYNLVVHNDLLRNASARS